MLNNILTNIGSSLSAIQKSQATHTENLANINTPGYIAKDPEYVDNGYGVSYTEVDKTIESRSSYISMLSANSNLNQTTKALSVTDLGLQPLQDVSSELRKTTGTPNAKDSLNAAINQFQLIYKNANESIQNSQQEQTTLTNQANQIIDDYGSIKNANPKSSQLSNYEYQHSEIAGVPLSKNNQGSKIQGITDGISNINGGITALGQDFNTFKNDVNKIYGANVITGTSINDAKIDDTAFAGAKPNPSPTFQDYSVNYENYRSSKITTLTTQQTTRQNVLNGATDNFQSNYGVNQAKEEVAMTNNSNVYAALTKAFSVVDDMFKNLLNL